MLETLDCKSELPRCANRVEKCAQKKSFVKSKSRLTQLMKAGRCRLHVVPLVESNPVVKAPRHQTLENSIQVSKLSWEEVRAVDTFNVLRLRYATLHSITFSVTVGCKPTTLYWIHRVLFSASLSAIPTISQHSSVGLPGLPWCQCQPALPTPSLTGVLSY